MTHGSWIVVAVGFAATVGCHPSDDYNCDLNPVQRCGRFRVTHDFGTGGEGGVNGGGAGGDAGAAGQAGAGVGGQAGGGGT